MKEALKRERNFSDSLIRTAQVIVVLFDTEGRIVRVNPYLESLTGLRADEVIGRDWIHTFVPEADRDKMRTRFGRWSAVTPTPGTITPIVIRDGSERIIEWRGTTLKDSDDAVVGLLAIGLDITGRTRMEQALRDREVYLNDLLSSIQAGVVIIDKESSAIIDINRAACDLFGAPREEMLGMPSLDVLPAESGKAPLDGVQEHPERPGEHVLITSKGDTVPIVKTSGTARLNDREVLVESFIDISGRKAVEEQLRFQKAYFQGLVHNLPEAVVIFDEEGLILQVNAAFELLFRYSPDECIGRNIIDLMTPSDRIEESRTLLGRITAGETVDIEIQRQGKGGFLLDVVLRSAPVIVDDAVIGYFVIYRDITERKSSESKLVEMATTDFLTGLFNRRYFMNSCAREFLRAKRYGHPVSVLMFDLDHFKSVNDTYGHDVGDRVLRNIAELGHESFRTGDIFGRVGGEEFSVLLPETEAEGATAVAERFRFAVEKAEMDTGAGTVRVTVSLGVACVSPETSTLDKALITADRALYKAKQNGRNRVEVSDEITVSQ